MLAQLGKLMRIQKQSGNKASVETMEIKIRGASGARLEETARQFEAQ
jgi:hypothetical protein